MRERELKPGKAYGGRAKSKSLPMRERELKRPPPLALTRLSQVAPHAGA